MEALRATGSSEVMLWYPVVAASLLDESGETVLLALVAGWRSALPESGEAGHFAASFLNCSSSFWKRLPNTSTSGC